MLHFLVTADHAYTLQGYFSQWGAGLSAQVRIIPYESRPWTHEPLPGAWIFTDLERLTAAESRSACEFAGRLAADPLRYRVLNDPRRVLLRHALLSDLAAAGINDFRAFRLADLPENVHYPIFIRGENDHRGALSDLLHDVAEFRLARSKLPDSDGLLAIEYLPYQREDGLFIKYSMMRIGEGLVTRHMFFSHDWLLKEPDLSDESLMQEEDRFLKEAPHRQAVMEVFRRSGIDYGRIDYTVAKGRVQVFEINTNPIILRGIAELAPRRWENQCDSARQMNGALEMLDAGLPAADPQRLLRESRGDRWRMRIFYKMRLLRLAPGPRF